MYLVPHDRNLIDGIHLPSFLQPRFADEVENPETPRRTAGKGPKGRLQGTRVARKLDMGNDSEDSESSSRSGSSDRSEESSASDNSDED